MSHAVFVSALESSTEQLPVFDTHVPAGFPSPALDHMEQKLSLDELLEVQAPHTYIVQVEGESMSGAGIFDGDLLIVSRGLNAKHGDVVIAAVNGEVLVKRLSYEQNQLVLRADNPKYSPRYILEGDELMIWGVVTHSIRPHR